MQYVCNLAQSETAAVIKAPEDIKNGEPCIVIDDKRMRRRRAGAPSQGAVTQNVTRHPLSISKRRQCGET
jgi:hypothetical protein